MSRFDQLDILGEAIGDVYADAVDRLLVNIARHFKYLQPGEEPGGAFRYQAEKLAELGQVNRENLATVRQLMGDIDEELSAGLEQAIADAIRDVEPALREAAEAGIFGEADIPPAMDPRSMRAFTLYHGQSIDRMNLVNTRMLESTADAYRGMVSDMVIQLRNDETQKIVNAATGQEAVSRDGLCGPAPCTGDYQSPFPAQGFVRARYGQRGGVLQPGA